MWQKCIQIDIRTYISSLFKDIPLLFHIKYIFNKLSSKKILCYLFSLCERENKNHWVTAWPPCSFSHFFTKPILYAPSRTATNEKDQKLQIFSDIYTHKIKKKIHRRKIYWKLLTTKLQWNIDEWAHVTINLIQNNTHCIVLVIQYIFWEYHHLLYHFWPMRPNK